MVPSRELPGARGVHAGPGLSLASEHSPGRHAEAVTGLPATVQQAAFRGQQAHRAYYLAAGGGCARSPTVPPEEEGAGPPELG